MVGTSRIVRQLSRQPNALVDRMIQIASLAVLIYWAAVLLQPFLTIIIWSIILTVVLYPGFEFAVERLRFPRVAAALLMTLLCVVILVGPAGWLGLSLFNTFRFVAEGLGSGDIAIPSPPDAVKQWPIIGDQVYGFWSLASTNLQAALVKIGPQLGPISTTLLGLAGGAGISMLKFIAAVFISGFLLLPGPALVERARSTLRRIAVKRGDEFVDLIGATIRNLARGVIGVSLLQALLAGVAIPIVIWAWMKMDTAPALIFTIYLVPVSLLNNVVRPFVMAHGLKTPMLIILVGVLGGILAHGVIGLFVGPIVLAIAWELLTAWSDQGSAEPALAGQDTTQGKEAAE
jgi:predicted PurR-regulated permease PerM